MGCGASSQRHVVEPSTPHKVANQSKSSPKIVREEEAAQPPSQQKSSSEQVVEEPKKLNHQQSTDQAEPVIEKEPPPPSDLHKEGHQHSSHDPHQEHAVPHKKRIKEEETENMVAQPPYQEHAEPPELEHPEKSKEGEDTFEPPVYGEEEEKAASVIQKKFKEYSAKKKVDRMLMCYLCGQKFGPTSLLIHLKPNNCPEQRMNDMKANIPKELVLSKLPSPPLTPIPDPEKATQEEVDAYNNEAYEIYTKKSMIHCPICSKGFEIDRLTVRKDLLK